MMEKKILIIDDDSDLRAILSEKLVAHGYTILETFDGALGLEKIRTEKPDMVLIDLRIPGLDGLSVIKEVKHDDTIKDTPILIMTGLDSDHAVMKVVADQKYEFVKKGQGADVIVSKVISSLQKS